MKKKNEENCHFSFWKIFAPLEAKMMKNEKKEKQYLKKWKNDKEMIQKMIKNNTWNDKKMKMIK